jgi:hypothetical protein
VEWPIICQSVRMGRLYSEDSKPKVSIESSQRLKARFFLQVV